MAARRRRRTTKKTAKRRAKKTAKRRTKKRSHTPRCRSCKAFKARGKSCRSCGAR